jgi:AcrR family transcriptional regulator
MATTSQDLRRVALREFAAAGYHGTSIQLIAERAGVSKASVLYH